MRHSKRAAIAVLSVLLVVTGLSGVAHATPESEARAHVWAGNNETEFEDRLGRQVAGGQKFVANGDKNCVGWGEQHNSLVTQLGTGSAPIRITLDLLISDANDNGTCDDPATLAAGAAGTYNLYFHQLAQDIAASNRTKIQLRLMHEANGGWYRWAYGIPGTSTNDPTKAQRFEQTWAQFYWALAQYVTVGETGRVQLEWNVSLGRGNFAGTTGPYDGFPDGGVSIISGDAYCRDSFRFAGNLRGRLDELANFSHFVQNHHLAIAEWSGWERKNATSCDENFDGTVQRSVRFVNDMWDWTRDNIRDHGDTIESVPFERDPDPEGWFSMVERVRPMTGDEYYTWSNGSKLVHDKETAQAFDNTFG